MFGPDAQYRMMPQASTYKKFGVDIYPHPYFDPASYYIPPTIREAFRWCIYLFLTNSIIGTLVRKKSAYVVTGLKYHTKNPVAAKIWKEVLETVLRIREFEYLMKIDHEVFGNAFCSIIYPFDRYLKCSYCGYENFIKSVPWTYTGDHFVATCKNCKSRAATQIVDHYVRNRNRIKLHRWFPDYIDPKRNPVTGRSLYILRIPRSLRFRIMNPKINKIFVEDTPKEILEAIAFNKVIELDPSNIYHWKQESISMEDDSLGIPPLMHVIKDIWLNQVYKKGQESIALEHIHPLTMLSPAPPPGGQSPHMNVDLLTWRNNMQNIISLWRRDPTALFPVPFPVQVSQLRGDAAALSLSNDLTLSRQDIAGGMDVPADFLYGNLTWTGGNVSLRVLENMFINSVGNLNQLLKWITGNIGQYLGLPECEVEHQDFKMADDVAQKNIALSLRASGTISDQTVLEELDFDYEEEKERRRREQVERISEMERQSIAQAEIDAKIAVIRAKADMEIQQMQQDRMAAMQPQQPQPPTQEEIGNEVMQQGPPQPQGTTAARVNGTAPPNQAMIEMQANNFIKSTPPDQMEYQIATLQQQNPLLSRIVRQKLATMQKFSVPEQPLPEQRAPRRGPETAMV